jgi:hypothetical protein
VSDGRAVAAAVTDLIGRLGGAFMISREAKGFAVENGLTGWAPYFRGRCGVLGEVDADVVASAAGFFPAEAVRDAWEAASGLSADAAVARYAQVAHEFGRRKLDGFGETGRLAELLDTVVGNADVLGAPLFAGWRAVPLPADGPARVIQLAHVLRELRGGLHIVAVLASGLGPLQAVLAGGSVLIPAGEANAEYFAWPRPYPDVTDEIRERRARAEVLTDTLIAPAFEVLSETESDELIMLLDQACATAFQ